MSFTLYHQFNLDSRLFRFEILSLLFVGNYRSFLFHLIAQTNQTIMWLVGAFLSTLCGVSLAATSTVMHPAFKNAGSQDGIKIWRIESFEPVAVSPNEYGKFYSGDSYIVLVTHEDKSKKGQFTWDIHYWLGEKTSQDESGAAAILSVELDDQLGGGPVQHREVQEHESQKFLSYFKNGVRYLPGGAASGFHHVTTNDPGEKKLYQIKGKKNVRVRQIEMSVKAMNKGDCFILDAGNDIYVFVGSSARGSERVKAISAANGIRDQDHAGRSKIHIIDSSSTPVEVEEFFKKLGSGSARDIPEETTGGADEDFEKTIDNTVTLYKVSDAGGKLVAEKVSQKPLKQDMLKTEDCFILDTVKSGIYVWIGKKATTQEKVEALKRGEAFLTNNNYPKWTKMRRVVENAEPAAFKEYFGVWTATVPRGGDGDFVLRKSRSTGRCGAATGFMPDSGEGSMEIFRVENLELAPTDPSSYGIFFAGDSYVIKYEYESEYGSPKFIIYFWQGRDSTNDEKTASALHALRLDNELSGKAIQIRVVQGDEPAHFLKIFNSKIIILAGGKASGFRNIRDYDTYDTDGTRLFQIMASCENDIRAIQVPEVAESLNGNDAFFLETPTESFLWIGKSCSQEEEKMGEWIKSRLCPDRELITLYEGDESSNFWEALGGPGPYDSLLQPDIPDDFEPVLYHCYINKWGQFKFEDIPSFTQNDLYTDDIMVLDTGDEMYMWIGNDSSEEEKQNAYQLAKRLTSRVRGGKDPVIITIKQGLEIPQFTKYFPEWDQSFWESTNQFDKMKNFIEEFNRSL